MKRLIFSIMVGAMFASGAASGGMKMEQERREATEGARSVGAAQGARLLWEKAAGDCRSPKRFAGLGASTGQGEQTTNNTVKIDNFSFIPQVLTVRVGAKVTWVNRDDVPHTVVSTDKRIKSGVLDTDEVFSYTFGVAGTNDYFCSVHPHMTGEVIVVSKPRGSAPGNR
jgi:plastocyanin